jgi:hypothetical protein
MAAYCNAKQELGWYFPVETLEDIVFIGDDNKNQDWQISTSRHRVFKGIVGNHICQSGFS